MISFLETIANCRNGALQLELDETLQATIKACVATGLKGELTFKLKVKPEALKDNTVSVEITPTVTSKNPKFSTGSSDFFVVTDDTDEPVALEREDPRQALMFQNLTKEIKEAGNGRTDQ